MRAEHARIDAIWFNPNVAPWTRKRVAAQYLSARIFADRRPMLAEHPLSTLDCYERSPRHRAAPFVTAGVLAWLVAPRERAFCGVRP